MRYLVPSWVAESRNISGLGGESCSVAAAVAYVPVQCSEKCKVRRVAVHESRRWGRAASEAEGFCSEMGFLIMVCVHNMIG